MVRFTQLSYRPANFVLFTMDVRCKIICICILSLVIVYAGYLHLSLITTALLWLLYRSGSNIRPFLKEFKFLSIILLLVFIVRVIVTPGVPIQLSALISTFITIDMDFLDHIRITKEGLIDGSIITWRFFIIMVLGILFSCSTSASSIKSSIVWFLRPIPFISEKKVGLMVSLFVRFMPVLFEKAYEVSDAQKSRCAHLQKNPFKKIRNLSVPLISRVFDSADTLAIAMASRCYNDNRTELTNYPFFYSGYEIYFYGGTIIISAIIVFF